MEGGNPIAEREQFLQALLGGEIDGVASDQAHDAVTRARQDLEGPTGRRSLGFAVVAVRPLYVGGDFQELHLVVTDGARDAAITVRVTGSNVAGLQARDTDVVEHALERLHNIVGGLPNDGNRYENVLLHHPITLPA